MPFAFGTASLSHLEHCDPRLVNVLELAISRSPFDWGIAQTARSIEQQRQYFKDGKSKVDPDKYPVLSDLYKAAKHIVGPGAPLSRAADVYLVGKDPYHPPTLYMLQGIIWSCAAELNVAVRSGLDFDRDGLIAEAGTFIDGPHIELDL